MQPSGCWIYIGAMPGQAKHKAYFSFCAEANIATQMYFFSCAQFTACSMQAITSITPCTVLGCFKYNSLCQLSLISHLTLFPFHSEILCCVTDLKPLLRPHEFFGRSGTAVSLRAAPGDRTVLHPVAQWSPKSSGLGPCYPLCLRTYTRRGWGAQESWFKDRRGNSVWITGCLFPWGAVSGTAVQVKAHWSQCQQWNSQWCWRHLDMSHDTQRTHSRW